MNCFQKGLITEEDTGGLNLRFGDADTMVSLVEKIARREGIGDLLAEGSARAAEHFGPEAQELVVAVKKLEYPAHMPQVKRSLGLIYAVNPFGADHESSEHDPSYQGFPGRMAKLGLTDPQPSELLNEEKVHFALTTQYLYSCLSCLNVCNFVFGPSWQLYDTQELLEALQAVTGWEVTIPEMLEVGQRRLNLQRAFNAREGIGRDQDTLPSKLEKALKGGKTDGAVFTAQELEEAKNIYYDLAGWDQETGYPLQETLEKLDLNWLAEEEPGW
jgi:aldehyde:ferredoxin oxidoreductase